MRERLPHHRKWLAAVLYTNVGYGLKLELCICSAPSCYFLSMYSIGTSVPNDEVKFLADIADVLPVTYLLPSTSGPGLCSLALSDFLLFQQNDLLEFCRNSQKYSW